jgi:hypothetical protein
LEENSSVDRAAETKNRRRVAIHFSTRNSKDIPRSLPAIAIYFARRLRHSTNWRIDEKERRAFFE